MLRKTCYQCFRPIKTCYCQWITPIDSGIKFVFLMHPKEAYKQKTGTGRLAKLFIKDSELIIDTNFIHQVAVNTLIETPDYFPVILYPGPDSLKASDPLIKFNLGTKKLLVFVVDATWPQSRKIIRLSTNLRHLTKISFQKMYPSQFSITRWRVNFRIKI